MVMISKQHKRNHARIWRDQNPDKVAAYRERWAGSYKSRLHKWKWHLKLNYGITPEQYDEIVRKQNSLCAICKKYLSEKRYMRLDHNHKTGIIRGILCQRCNLVLTIFDNDELLQRALNYVGKDREIRR